MAAAAVARRLLEQRRVWPVHRHVAGQHTCDDFANAGIHAEVQLAPGPARAAMLLLRPLTLFIRSSERMRQSYGRNWVMAV